MTLDIQIVNYITILRKTWSHIGIVSAGHGCMLLALALQTLPFTQAFTLSNGLVRATSQLYGSASKWSSLIHHSWFILVPLSESVCCVWAESFIRHLVSWILKSFPSLLLDKQYQCTWRQEFPILSFTIVDQGAEEQGWRRRQTNQGGGLTFPLFYPHGLAMQIQVFSGQQIWIICPLSSQRIN